MRRLGLLTAVFALAVGIVVAFEASPDAAQPQPRAHVYLLRGLLNIFSLGMDTLAEELKGRDVYATVHSYSEWQTLADQATADYKAGKEAPIILIGHSLGADSVMEMAANLGRKGVPVALAVPFGCTKSFAASDNWVPTPYAASPYDPADRGRWWLRLMKEQTAKSRQLIQPISNHWPRSQLCRCETIAICTISTKMLAASSVSSMLMWE